jgi:hypothetical protein
VVGRLQLNYGDPESSYYSSAAYLGKKNTIAIGGSYDYQPNIGTMIDTVLFKTDYMFFNVDVFAEQQIGGGALTFEGAYYNLDMDSRAPRLEGDGFYVQAGYLFKNDKWQPWGLYETWSSEDPNNAGSFDSFRVGLSYYWVGFNANIKAGYERINSDTTIGSTNEDTLDTFLIGFYTNY